MYTGFRGSPSDLHGTRNLWTRETTRDLSYEAPYWVGPGVRTGGRPPSTTGRRVFPGVLGNVLCQNETSGQESETSEDRSWCGECRDIRFGREGRRRVLWTPVHGCP